MDLLKILRSFEEFIFEATTWLLFYPWTLWRIVSRPLAAMDYSDRQQTLNPEARYDDAMSPPLALLVTVVLVNLAAMAFHLPPPASASKVVKLVYSSQQNLALFRALVFSLIPLIAAATLLKRQRIALAREALKGPFYAQCYLACPSVAVLGIGSIMVQRQDLSTPAGAVLIAGATVWFLVMQTRWFATRLRIAWPAAAATAIWAAVQAVVYLLALLIPIALL